MKNYTRVCARINLDVVEYNIEMMKKNLSGSAKMIVVIKTDGYGHGAVPIAKMLEEKEYVWGFAVATLDEARDLKDSWHYETRSGIGLHFPRSAKRDDCPGDPHDGLYRRNGKGSIRSCL